MKKNWLLWTRRGVATVVFALFFLAFVAGIAPIPELARFQVGPALVAGSVIFLGAILILTLLFGRAYCAALCPLGITQDILGALFGKTKREPYPNYFWLRMLVLVAFIATLATGNLFVFGLLDPYSAFGRVGRSLFAPIFDLGINIMALGGDIAGFPLLARRETPFAGLPAFLAAFVTFAALVFFVWKWGRVWCDYCPVGSALGYLGKKSFLRTRLNRDKCVKCRRCEKVCSSGCVNINNGGIDNTRCVVCQKCVAACPTKALTYGKTK
ncbi:MAG: 4Fe-4S binding protein [Desulfovibrio sp.]|nr:4Fe-4S binding protein [Desulfovibrio sp.]